MSATAKGMRARIRAVEQTNDWLRHASLSMSDVLLHHARPPHGLDHDCEGCRCARKIQGIHEQRGQLDLKVPA